MPSRPGGAAGQQARVALQAGGELRGPERRAPGRGQLDSQRHAVQPGAHLGDRGRVAVGQRERGARRAGPGDEQAAGLGRGDRVGRAVFRQFQRRDREDEFAGHVQAFPAGGHDADPGALPGQHDHHPAADARTCSQLSSTISSSRPASARTTPAIGLAASRSGTPSAAATDAGTSAASVREASSTSRAPSSKPPAASAAARSPSRVLPHPPGPVNVTTRDGAQAIQDRGELRPSPDQRAHLRGQAGVPLDPAFGHDHPPGRASGMTRSAGIYPVRQMLAAAGETHAPSQGRITLR